MDVGLWELAELRCEGEAKLRRRLAETDAALHALVVADEISEELVTHLVNWLRLEAALAHAHGFTLGISGGVDSAVTAALVERATPSSNRYFYLPCQSVDADRQAAELVAEALSLQLETVELLPLYVAACAALGAAPAVQPTPLSLMNLKAMLRMTLLATVANEHGLLVAGTGNRSEGEHVGFMTKRGDGAADNAVLGLLFKRQVCAVARLVGVPEEIVTRPPTPGLRVLPDGTTLTDEAEMGMTYREIELATRLWMEFGADLATLTAAVCARYPAKATRVLTVCRKLGLRSWRNRHKLEPLPWAGLPRRAVPRFEEYPAGFPTVEELLAWKLAGE
ncbi:MAG: NAD(+) synthase [Chloroflexota bacterium]|nr:NAD(+) synthase [Chloroflexota bacterium]